MVESPVHNIYFLSQMISTRNDLKINEFANEAVFIR